MSAIRNLIEWLSLIINWEFFWLVKYMVCILLPIVFLLLDALCTWIEAWFRK